MYDIGSLDNIYSSCTRRNDFSIPQKENQELLYFNGNSLGLQCKQSRDYLLQVMDMRATLGIEGYFTTKDQRLTYYESLLPLMASIVGGKEGEVAIMNTLTVNLHCALAKFYRPSPEKDKIIIESTIFPSDRYALVSHCQLHGLDPQEVIIEIPTNAGGYVIDDEQVYETIDTYGKETALILLGGVNYLSGQVFDMQKITEVGHSQGCIVGFDLAHAAGNIPLKLHDRDVDFAVRCNYKYLNAGPGAIGGLFQHQRFADNNDTHLAGRRGHDKQTRFDMGPEFMPIPGAEGLQISCPDVLALASLRGALETCCSVEQGDLFAKSRLLTKRVMEILQQYPDHFTLITPTDESKRGAQVSFTVKQNPRLFFEQLTDSGVVCDRREPNVIRIAPVPLYNIFYEIEQLKEKIAHILSL